VGTRACKKGKRSFEQREAKKPKRMKKTWPKSTKKGKGISADGTVRFAERAAIRAPTGQEAKKRKKKGEN